MDSIPSTSKMCSRNHNSRNRVEAELVYLIAKYLSVGPCTKSYEVLKAEINENKILPTRTDWLGNEHERSFNEYDMLHANIGDDFLLHLVSRLQPTVQKLFPTFPLAKTSVLGAGSQSALRSEKDLTRSYKTVTDAILKQRDKRGIDPVNLIGVPNLMHALIGREICGFTNKRHYLTNKLYSRLQIFVRNVGHLSAIYCMLFDRSGRYIVTGADDALVKIWSARDGRLEATLRGASAEISDLALDHENQLVAAGSCDKVIRVWSLHTLAPVAVLTSHTGMITALQFCPSPGAEGVLVSTGGDGCVAFWTYSRKRTGVKFDPKPLKLNERVRPGHAQLICASFSTGGSFLAVGGADHFVRVYRLGGPDGVEKLIEVETHKDRVDSIQWCHQGVGFVSGSRDGSALVWRYERQRWKTTELSMNQTLPGAAPRTEETKQVQVTMVGWDRTDSLVITASSDHLLRVWNSRTGALKRVLTGHEDNAYVIEAHPTEERLVLTAGHDGLLFIWDVLAGTAVKSFKNTIEGQGHGALFDAKWAPDGLSIAATDSHGHILIFGIGHNELFKKIPQELFFHTDYRPLVRDVNHHVLDEQTQLAPHVMPPPFLVNIDGDPYPPEVQRLVPGRGNCRVDQLIPNVVTNDHGEQEVLDLAIADGDHPRSLSEGQDSFEEPHGRFGVDEQSARPSVDNLTSRPNIDDMIERLAQEQQERRASHRSRDDEPGPSGINSGSERRASSSGPHPDHSYAVAAGHDPLSPRAGRVGARREGDIEGVRQSRGNWQRDPHMKWKRRLFLSPLSSYVLERSASIRTAHGDYEAQLFEEEGRKRPEAPTVKPGEEEKEDRGSRKNRRRQKKTHAYSTRASRVSQEPRRGFGPGRPSDANRSSGSSRSQSDSRVPRTQVAFGTDFEDPDSVRSQDEQESSSSSSSPSSSSPSSPSSAVKEALEDESSSSSGEESTDYSDWTADVGVGLEPPKRTAHRQKTNPVPVNRKKRKKKLDEEVEDESNDEEEKRNEEKGRKRERKKRGENGEKRQSNARRRKDARGLNMAESDVEGGDLEEIPPAFRPPEWLSETVPKKAPFFPQMGDEIMYFRQGHQLYVEAVITRGLYAVDKRSLPWIRKHNLRDEEWVKIIGMKYEIKPPRLCCLKLGIMEGGVLTGDSFTIKYHDMPDVLDFLVLKSTYDTAVSRNWKSGDQFRCIIDDAWWLGIVEAQDPHLPEFPDSMFMCYRVLWDNGERERLSPWDMEPIDEQMVLPDVGGSIRVCPEEYKALVYTPSPEDWAPPSFEAECHRMAEGIGKIMELSVAEPFLAPVDLNVYPNYALIVEYPMDLSTIKSRLESHFYRRPNAAQFDVRYIATNAEKFNKKGSVIVRYARIVTDLALKLIKDPSCRDPTVFYHAVQANYHSPNHSEEEEEKTRRRQSGRSRSQPSLRGEGMRPVTPKGDTRPWQQQCRDLLKSMYERQDSIPFRYPVDLERYKDYNQVIDVPMDLSTVREELSAGGYSSPLDFAKDVRLVFSNSKNYNTNNKSRIYSMTVRLEAFFEDQIKGIFSRCKNKEYSSEDSASPGPSGSFREKDTKTNGFLSDASEEDEDARGSVNEGGMRRSRRVAQLRRLRGNDSESDEDEDYWPGKKSPQKPQSSRGTPVGKNYFRGRMSNSPQSGERREKGGPVKRSLVKKYEEDSDFEAPIEAPPRRCSSSSASRRSKRYEDDSDFETAIPVPKKEPEAGERFENKGKRVKKCRKKISKKITSEEDEEDGELSDNYDDDDNELDEDKDEKDEETKEKRLNGSPFLTKGKRRIESSDEDPPPLVNGVKKEEEEEEEDVSDEEEEESENDSDSEGDEKASVDSQRIPISSFGERKMREESEVEFDEEELEESEDDEEEEEEDKGRKRGVKRGRQKGVGVGVRRARRKVMDQDDLEEDEDYVADDHDFIDDDDATSSSEDDDSEEDSDELGGRPKRRRKMSAKEKQRKKLLARKMRAKQARAIAKAKAKMKEAKAKAKAKAKEKAKKAKMKAAQSAAKKTTVKTAIKRSKSGQKKTPGRPNITLTPPLSNLRNSQAPFPYNPIGIDYRTHCVEDVVADGKVIGRVISRIDEASTSSISENDFHSLVAPNGSLEKEAYRRRMVERVEEAESDGDEVGRRGRVRKKVRYNEDSEEGEAPSVSSRGRVLKANTRMRDFI